MDQVKLGPHDSAAQVSGERVREKRRKKTYPLNGKRRYQIITSRFTGKAQRSGGCQESEGQTVDSSCLARRRRNFGSVQTKPGLARETQEERESERASLAVSRWSMRLRMDEGGPNVRELDLEALLSGRAKGTSDRQSSGGAGTQSQRETGEFRRARGERNLKSLGRAGPLRKNGAGSRVWDGWAGV